jgi:hypothetical protein
VRKVWWYSEFQSWNNEVGHLKIKVIFLLIK